MYPPLSELGSVEIKNGLLGLERVALAGELPRRCVQMCSVALEQGTHAAEDGEDRP